MKKMVNNEEVELTEEEIIELENFRNSTNFINLKNKLIKIRKNYLKQTYEVWFDDVENIPNEIKTKRTQYKSDINLIEECTTLQELNNYTEEF